MCAVVRNVFLSIIVFFSRILPICKAGGLCRCAIRVHVYWHRHHAALAATAAAVRFSWPAQCVREFQSVLDACFLEM